MKSEITSPTPPGRVSLPEVHATVATAQPNLWRRVFAFAGPAYLVSVGYMDPGNWATDLEGGARFGYDLLRVIVLSNFMAILLQTLSARLGIVTRRDLAQACRETYPKQISWVLWIFCELAIAACDLAEVLGAAIGLNLLFHIPLLAGVLLTAADTLLLLWLTGLGIRRIEAFILSLIAIIAGCFLVELGFAHSPVAQVFSGLVPRLNDQSLYVAIAILGATVMPHNLYLHSALVQTRRIGHSSAEKRRACLYNLVDSVIALNFALVVNAAILVLAATVFFTRGIVVTEIQQAHLLLSPLLGTTMASALFAIALLCSGQSSTLTGTMAGQIVMEGFLDLRMRPWLRRLITRFLAIIPAAITVYIAGDRGTYQLLILSQVILNLQLPFAVIPLIHFTGDRKRMGEFANRWWVNLLAWSCAVLIVVLNARLAYLALEDWTSKPGYEWLWIPSGVVLAGVVVLLAWIALEPLLPHWIRRFGQPVAVAPRQVAENLAAPTYRTILVPLDHTPRDRNAILHAAALAQAHKAAIFLLHVEEGVTSQLYGDLSSTAEVEEGERYFSNIVHSLTAQGIEVNLAVQHSNNPAAEIVRYARRVRPDLVVMSAHGHKGLKDIVLGNTINQVRHALDMPILVVT